MSIAIRPKRSIPMPKPAVDAESKRMSRDVPTPARPKPEEAPDRGDQGREAPDAGYGRSGSLENVFTHGRSQS